MFYKKILTIALLAVTVTAVAQEGKTEQEPARKDSSTVLSSRKPFIELFRPIYLNAGIPVTEKPTSANADVKFQISFALPLWRNMRGSGIDLLIAYSQISVWNLFGHSSPFYDNMYIPGIYARKTWNDPAGMPKRSLLWGIEHRSNGRDDAYSRSVNYILLAYARNYPFGLSLQAVARPGYGWYGDTVTMDVPLKYYGFLQMSATYTTPGAGWEFMASVSPIWNRSIANVNVEIGRRLGKKNNNPYFFIQFHYGYDEAFRDCMDENGPLLDENGNAVYYYAPPIPPKAMIRAGIILSPHNMMRGNL